MLDPRLDALAEVLIGFSTNLQKGERFLIDAYDVPQEIVIALIRNGRSRGAVPFVNLQSNTIVREMLRGAEESQYRTLCDFELARMTVMDAYIALRGSHNATEFSDVDPGRMQVAMKLLQPLLERRLNKTKWVVLRWPTGAMAQMAGMSTEAFEDYFFKVCTTITPG
jgi:aminopeptidase